MASVAAIPSRAMESQGALLDYVRPLLLHAMPDSLLYVTGFYLIFKFVLFSTVAFFVFTLIRQGKFWLFRIVQVPRGKIVVPNSCEGLLVFAGIFYLTDAAFRGCLIHFFWDMSSKQTNVMIFSGLRLIPLWTAAFVHLVATGLLWPVSPEFLRPAPWHAFFFGMPAIFIATLIAPMILSNTAMNSANGIYQPLRQRLLAQPGATVNPEDVNDVQDILNHLYTSYYHTRIWAGIGTAWVCLLIILTLVVGVVLIVKTYRAVQIEKKSTDEPVSSSFPTQSCSYEAHTAAFDQPSNETRNLSRRLLSLVLRKLDTPATHETLKGKPTKRARIAVLANFLAFTSAQMFFLLALEVVFLAVIAYVAHSSLADLRYNDYIPFFQNRLQRTIYFFHMIETWAVVLLGTPLVLMMLHRQCYPIKVEVQEAVHGRRARPASTASNVGSSDEHDSSTAYSRSPKTPQLGWDATAERSRGPDGREDDRQEASETLRDTFQDACGYIGTGAGRSIVLQALQRADQYPRRRPAPWHSIQQDNTSEPNSDLEATDLTPQLYVTPHGTVEGIPLSPLPRPVSASKRDSKGNNSSPEKQILGRFPSLIGRDQRPRTAGDSSRRQSLH